MRLVKLKINEKVIEALEGEILLKVAKENGVRIPHLCYDPRLKPYGACRLCLVEIKGERKLQAACATPVKEGMEVITESVTLYEIRRTIIDLLLSTHPEDCLTCEACGRCALQDLAYEYGLRKTSYKGERPYAPLEDHNPLVFREREKCVLCGRCVRICSEVQGVNAYTFANRGFKTIIATAFDEPLSLENCEFCGQCISTCPTAAITSRLEVGKARDWETKEVLTTCPYCGCGCQIVLRVKDNQVVGVKSYYETHNRGNLCGKGRFGWEFVNHSDRLTTPLIKKKGKFVEADWDEALELITKRFKLTKEKFGSDSLAFLASAKCTNEENYLLQKLARVFFGTNNIDHCARL